MQHIEAPSGYTATAQAAQRLGVSKQTVRRYAAGGVLSSLTVNGGIFVRTTDVELLIDQRANFERLIDQRANRSAT
jgi:predicted site-specific integrase-resolvase